MTEADFKNYIAAANHAISNLDLEIRSTLHQTSAARVYALVNTASDPVTQLATIFTPDEMGFVKRVLDAMFESNNTARHEVMAVPTMQAINMHNKTAGGRRTSSTQQEGEGETQGGGAQAITITQAEKVLQGLVEQGWFEKSRKGFYALSPRALMELRGWLIETYNETEDSDEDIESTRPMKIKVCYACKEIVTVVSIRTPRLAAANLKPQGQRCPKRACQCRLHDICTQNFFRMQKAKKCPLCKEVWTGEDLVGEKAAPTATRKRKSGATQSVAAEAAESSQRVEVDENDEDDN